MKKKWWKTASKLEKVLKIGKVQDNMFFTPVLLCVMFFGKQGHDDLENVAAADNKDVL